MSRKHGNHPDACDICDEVDEAYKSGVADGKRTATVASTAPTDASSAPADELPLLPDPYGTIPVYEDDPEGAQTHEVDGWTMHQMRGYAIDYGNVLIRRFASGHAAIAAQQAAPDARLNGDQCHTILKAMALDADDWAEGLNYEPTEQEISKRCVEFILARAALASLPVPPKEA